MSLYKLNSEMAELESQLEHVEDPNDSAVQALIAKAVETNGLLKDKVDAYCGLIRNIEALGDPINAEIDRLKALLLSRQAKVNALKKCLQDAMTARGIKSLEGVAFRVSIQKVGGKQSMDVQDALVPPEYRKTELIERIDTTAIREALEAGQELPFARLLPRAESLRIK